MEIDDLLKPIFTFAMPIGVIWIWIAQREEEEESFEQLLRKGGNTHRTVNILQDLKVKFPTVSILFPSTSLQTEIEKIGCFENVVGKRQIISTYC